jgi:Carboxypeptidase regulatory-like domain
MSITAKIARAVPNAGAPLAAFCKALILAVLWALVPSSGGAQAPAQSEADQSATIHGVVVSTTDQKPIPRALVTLFSGNRSVLTDDEGRFTFPDVPFGSAGLFAKKPEFLCGAAANPRCRKNLDVYSADVSVTLALIPQAVIAGRIADQAGKPVEGLDLYLLRKEIVDGLTKWSIIGQTRSKTDGYGRFRIPNLEAGAYLLETSVLSDPSESPAGADHGYAATYYPGTQDLSLAKPILVRAGEEFNADLTPADQKFQPVTLTLGWNRAWASDDLQPIFSLFAAQREGIPQPSFDPDSLTFRGLVPPGDYKFWVTLSPKRDRATGDPLPWPDGSKQPLLARAEFTVKDQPVTVAAIPLEEPVTIPLHVRAELSEQEKQKAAATVANPYAPPAALFTLTGSGVEFNDQVQWRNDRGPSDLAFKEIPPGSYVVRAGSFRNSYVAQFTCGNLDLRHDPLVIGPGVPSCAIEAVVRDDMARIAIGLTPTAESALKAAGITVVDAALIPFDEPLELPYSTAVWRDSQPEMKMVRPGRYLVFLFDGRANAWRDPDERKRLMGLGIEVNLAPLESKMIQLDWLPELNDPLLQANGVALGQVLP